MQRVTGVHAMFYLRKIAAQFLVLLVFATVPPAWSASDVDKLEASEAHELALRGAVVLIDVRTPAEWQKTGIGISAQAVSMHLPGFFDKINAIVGGDKTRPIALICATGRRSVAMQAIMRKRGYTNIIDVPEGMLGSAAGPGWIAKDLPVQNPG